jgi:hypothetical protein
MRKRVGTSDNFHGNYPDGTIEVSIINETRNPNPAHRGYRIIAAGNDDFGFGKNVPTEADAIALFDRMVAPLTIDWLQANGFEQW